MLACEPGEAIWLREGILLIKEFSIEPSGMPVGSFLKKPCRGIFLDRKVVKSKMYIKAYVDSVGERYIEESEVLNFQERNKHVS